MESKVYPDLESMCRLCLKEDGGTVHIFPNEENSEKYTSMSIPMRIMTCAALEVQSFDAFPKKICKDCRLQLEKSYYFRKRSQASDGKMRKHLRLLGMGKTSNVFNQKMEEDDYDELDFQDSLKFIREYESQQKQKDKLKIEAFMNEMKIQNEKDLKKVRENLRATCREELVPEIREELRKELQTEIKKELEENIRKEVTEQCMSQAKESLRAEVRDECRQLEIKCLLDDLQMYLNNKDKSYASALTKANVRKRPISPIVKNDHSKIKYVSQNLPEMAMARVELGLNNSAVEKENIVVTENMTTYQNMNDEECESEGNFLICDMEDEGFDVQKKSSDDDENAQEVEFEDDEFLNGDIVSYEKVSEDFTESNEDTGGITSTTSYRIEDGEIKFLKRCSEVNTIDEETPDQANDYKNIMVINIDEGLENEFVEHFEEVEQEENNNQAKTESSNKKSPPKKRKSSKVTTTSLISETTLLTKTYVNPLQRCTDTPKIFKCEDCPMVFSTKASLERHLRSHRKVEKTGVTFQCPECHIVVSCGSALRRHMYVHCDEKPFACNLCDKAFVQKEILKRHMQTHTGIKPHQCPHCERSFAQRINLKQHVNRTHLEKPHIQQYCCHLCPKRFNHASGLSRHLASHSGVAFQCSECERTFGDRSSIRRHILNMHSQTKASKDDAKTKSDKIP